MKITVQEVQGQRYGEGAPGELLIESVEDATTILETCFADALNRLLLYPENLPEHFFDLSSGDAGALLQKLRNYHIRLAIVRTPTLRLSSRFGELLEEEKRGSYFRLFDERPEAQAWLCAE